jgi:hypothetical protein
MHGADEGWAAQKLYSTTYRREFAVDVLDQEGAKLRKYLG